MIKTAHTRDSLKSTLVMGIKGMTEITGLRTLFFSGFIGIAPIVIAFSFLLLSFFLKIQLLPLIIEIKNIMLNFIPGILGFTVAGYTLIVGFIHAGMLSKITEPQPKSKFSLYQVISAKVGMNIIFQASALCIAYLFHFINYFDEKKNIIANIPEIIVIILNAFGVVIITYSFCIALFMTIQVVLNIYSFSQLHHYITNIEKIKIKEEHEKSQNELEGNQSKTNLDENGI